MIISSPITKSVHSFWLVVAASLVSYFLKATEKTNLGYFDLGLECTRCPNKWNNICLDYGNIHRALELPTIFSHVSIKNMHLYKNIVHHRHTCKTCLFHRQFIFLKLIKRILLPLKWCGMYLCIKGLLHPTTRNRALNMPPKV